MISNSEKKVIIVAPFWGKEGHVGNYRIDRFVRWLKNENYLIVLLKAGNKNTITEKEWGMEVTSRDFIGMITGWLRKFSDKIKVKVFLHSWFVLILKFLPIDEFYIWSTRISKIQRLDELLTDANLIISSSPPNSVHIATFKLSKKYSIPFVTDLRDGWMDEPLKQKLDKIIPLRIMEANIEKKILNAANGIFVTSNVWKEMLLNRFPSLIDKIIVLTNAYPEQKLKSLSKSHTTKRKTIKLLYTGRFMGSRQSGTISILLKPLFEQVGKRHENVEIQLLSELTRDEFVEFEKWKIRFATISVPLKTNAQISRDEMFEFISKSDGLLLLSTGMGPLPSKLFEYIKSVKPIFAVTSEGSAVWYLRDKLPQLYLFDYLKEKKDYYSAQKFLEACKTGNYEYKIPEEFSEKYLSKIFMDEIKSIP